MHFNPLSLHITLIMISLSVTRSLMHCTSLCFALIITTPCHTLCTVSHRQFQEQDMNYSSFVCLGIFSLAIAIGKQKYLEGNLLLSMCYFMCPVVSAGTDADWNPYSALIMMKNESAVVVTNQFRARITTRSTTTTTTTPPRYTRTRTSGMALRKTLLDLFRKYLG